MRIDPISLITLVAILAGKKARLSFETAKKAFSDAVLKIDWKKDSEENLNRFLSSGYNADFEDFIVRYIRDLDEKMEEKTMEELKKQLNKSLDPWFKNL